MGNMSNMSDPGAPTRDHLSMHAVTLAAAQRRVEHLERAIALETQRRHEEELRALLEGSVHCLVPTACIRSTLTVVSNR